MYKPDTKLLICDDVSQAHPREACYLLNGYLRIDKKKNILTILNENSDLHKKTLQNIISTLITKFDEFSKNKISNNDLHNLLLFGSSLVEQCIVKSNAWTNALKILTFKKEIETTKAKKITYRGSNFRINN